MGSMMRLIALLQDRAASLFGLEPDRRTPLVHAMLHRPRGDAAGYWLQLVIAVASAATFAWMLPFHEVTAELLAFLRRASSISSSQLRVHWPVPTPS
jgi:hypothetical protein